VGEDGTAVVGEVTVAGGEVAAIIAVMGVVPAVAAVGLSSVFKARRMHEMRTIVIDDLWRLSDGFTRLRCAHTAERILRSWVHLGLWLGVYFGGVNFVSGVGIRLRIMVYGLLTPCSELLQE